MAPRRRRRVRARPAGRRPRAGSATPARRRPCAAGPGRCGRRARAGGGRRLRGRGRETREQSGGGEGRAGAPASGEAPIPPDNAKAPGQSHLGVEHARRRERPGRLEQRRHRQPQPFQLLLRRGQHLGEAIGEVGRGPERVLWRRSLQPVSAPHCRQPDWLQTPTAFDAAPSAPTPPHQLRLLRRPQQLRARLRLLCLLGARRVGKVSCRLCGRPLPRRAPGSAPSDPLLKPTPTHLVWQQPGREKAGDIGLNLKRRGK
jgi:hypothetical protein